MAAEVVRLAPDLYPSSNSHKIERFLIFLDVVVDDYGMRLRLLLDNEHERVLNELTIPGFLLPNLRLFQDLSINSQTLSDFEREREAKKVLSQLKPSCATLWRHL